MDTDILAISITTLFPLGTILLCLPFLAPCHLLSCITFPLHLWELCILSYCCPGSLPFLLAGHPTYAFSSNQHLFSFKENHTIPGSSFDKSSFVVVVLSCAVSQHGFEETSLPKWLFFVPSPSQATGSQKILFFLFFHHFFLFFFLLYLLLHFLPNCPHAVSLYQNMSLPSCVLLTVMAI